MNERRLKIALLITILVSFSISTFLFFQNYQLRQQITSSKTQSSIPSTPSIPSPSNQTTEDWPTYTNEQFGFSFKYPSSYNSNCCAISGPPNDNDRPLITIANLPSDVPGSDAPFDGLSIFIRENSESLSLEEFIEREKLQLLEFYKNSLSGGPFVGIRQGSFIISNQEGVTLEGFGTDGITRYYLQLPNRDEILLISRLDENKIKKSFESTFTQILSTFKFLGEVDKETTVKKSCLISGCSGEICAEEEIASACIYREEFTCYKDAICERQENGKCGWTQTRELISCLERFQKL